MIKSGRAPQAASFVNKIIDNHINIGYVEMQARPVRQQKKLKEVKMLKRVIKTLGIVIVSLVAAGSVSAKTVDWKFYGVLPPSHEFSKNMIQSFENIKEKTGGELNITFSYFAETPYGVGDALRIIRDGLVEMVEWTPAYTAGTYPIMSGPELPFLIPELLSAGEAQEATNKAWQAPIIVEHLNKLMARYRSVQVSKYYFEPMNFWFTSEVSGLSEIKGKKIRVFMPVQGELVKSIGGIPVTVPTTEQYTSLQRNVINGTITGSGNLEGAKLGEVLKSGYISNIMMISSRILVSKRKLDGLDSKNKDIFMEEMAALEKRLAKIMTERDTNNLKYGEKLGMSFTKASPEDYLNMRKAAQESVWPAWEKDAGPDASKALEQVLKTQE